MIQLVDQYVELSILLKIELSKIELLEWNFFLLGSDTA